MCNKILATGAVTILSLAMGGCAAVGPKKAEVQPTAIFYKKIQDVRDLLADECERSPYKKLQLRSSDAVICRQNPKSTEQEEEMRSLVGTEHTTDHHGAMWFRMTFEKSGGILVRAEYVVYAMNPNGSLRSKPLKSPFINQSVRDYLVKLGGV